jgi:hypothetical protein
MLGYAITDTNKTVWVCKDNSGMYSLTTDRNRALIFESKPAAETVFKSNLSKLIKSKGVLVKAVTLQIAGPEIKEVKEEPVVKEKKQEPVEFGSSKYIISVISDAVSKLNCRHLSLTEEQSKYDRRLTDIEHYIEFNAGKLNACDGYKAYKLIQDCLVERRKVKDELQMIQAVRDKMAFPEDIAKIDSKVCELESRRYEPRELNYLFQN